MEKIPDSIVRKLDRMTGGLYLYKGRQVRIKSVNQIGDQLRIVTGGMPVVINLDKVEQALEDFLPVEDEPSAGQKAKAVQVFQNDSNQIENLEKMVMDNIEKVKDDPDYLPQAKAVTNNVNTMIKMTKLKIEMLKEIRKHNGG